ncbi:MAG: hypothetical protein A3K19_02150 [Lentisphaerae bacterium RIFOXYB12_FULL_65_16]|nr:MAG: hypothetical protein A3K18_12850 [Lentisphaerae bacterium RIFOXYA12_64_32]OGV93998.1 MAG: hypothetical protein A3K19_02150 [Lentisphaerae bacterium RIFOXYB12_FULL_65_16]
MAIQIDTRVERILTRLGRRLGWLGIPHLSLILVAGQLTAYVLSQMQLISLADLMLDAVRVQQGEVWRLITFLFIPPGTNFIFMAFGWYMFCLMGDALEHEWGEFRYTVYLLVGYLATLAFGWFVVPGSASSGFLAGSVFLAFAVLFPDFQILLFFILPVKVKHLALLTWVWYGFLLLVSAWPTRLMVIASCLNYFLFFGELIVHRMRMGRRKMKFEAQVIKSRVGPDAFHRCAVCGLTERDDRNMDFRVCMECTGGKEYCQKHLSMHTHS